MLLAAESLDRLTQALGIMVDGSGVVGEVVVDEPERVMAVRRPALVPHLHANVQATLEKLNGQVIVPLHLEHVAEVLETDGLAVQVRVVLADDSIQPGAMNRIRSVFPNILEVIQPRPKQIESPSVNREEDLSPGDIVELWLDDYFPSLDTRYRQTVNDSVNETLAGVGDETP